MRSNWFVEYKLAHRGLHNDIYPENSLGAYENAIKHGFAIELDIRVLKDGNLAIFHDDNLNRMCGVNKKIEDITLDEMKSYPLLNTKYTIPTIQEVLSLVNGRVPIMAELKPVSRKMKIAEKVYNVIKDYKGDIAIKSFNPLYMLWYKKNAPEVLRGMLSSYFHHTHLPWVYRSLIKRLTFYNRIKPDFISYDFNDLPNKYLKNKSVPILTWTITSKQQEQEALKYAHNVIFQDYIPDSPKNKK